MKNKTLLALAIAATISSGASADAIVPFNLQDNFVNLVPSSIVVIGGVGGVTASISATSIAAGNTLLVSDLVPGENAFSGTNIQTNHFNVDHVSTADLSVGTISGSVTTSVVSASTALGNNIRVEGNLAGTLLSNTQTNVVAADMTSITRLSVGPITGAGSVGTDIIASASALGNSASVEGGIVALISSSAQANGAFANHTASVTGSVGIIDGTVGGDIASSATAVGNSITATNRKTGAGATLTSGNATILNTNQFNGVAANHVSTIGFIVGDVNGTVSGDIIANATSRGNDVYVASGNTGIIGTTVQTNGVTPLFFLRANHSATSILTVDDVDGTVGGVIGAGASAIGNSVNVLGNQDFLTFGSAIVSSNNQFNNGSHTARTTLNVGVGQTLTGDIFGGIAASAAAIGNSISVSTQSGSSITGALLTSNTQVNFGGTNVASSTLTTGVLAGIVGAISNTSQAIGNSASVVVTL